MPFSWDLFKWGWDKMDAIFQTHFKCIFFNENVWILLCISLKFVPKFRINNIPSLFQIMAWRWPSNKPLSEQMMVSSLTHICVTQPQWVKLASVMSWVFRQQDTNINWGSKANWHHRKKNIKKNFTYFQCLMAPSHYLNQCWLIISKV